jgi:hypothetical protein
VAGENTFYLPAIIINFPVKVFLHLPAVIAVRLTVKTAEIQLYNRLSEKLKPFQQSIVNNH